MRLKRYEVEQIRKSQLVMLYINRADYPNIQAELLKVTQFTGISFMVDQTKFNWREYIDYREVGEHTNGRIVCPIEDVSEILDIYKARKRIEYQKLIESYQEDLIKLDQLTILPIKKAEVN